MGTGELLGRPDKMLGTGTSIPYKESSNIPSRFMLLWSIGLELETNFRVNLSSTDNGDGTIPEIPTTGSSAKRPCSSGKYWMVYEYSHGKQRNIKSEIRVQFVLEDRERRAVEIHTINANMTVKTVKVSNMTKRHFDLINSNNEYKDLGKIREGKF